MGGASRPSSPLTGPPARGNLRYASMTAAPPPSEPVPSGRPPWHPERLAARLPFLRRRALLTQATRQFFLARGYTEVETRYAVPTPGEEVHLRAFATEREHTDGTRTALWLHTSPEFAMKKLLAGGAGPIFQFARVWRNNEGGDLHAAEFTMLEWYRPGADMDSLIAETMALLRAVLPPVVTCRGVTTSLAGMERLTMAEAFARHVGADLLATCEDVAALAAAAGVAPRQRESWEDLFFRLLLARIEPEIGRACPTFLTHWPAAQAALARRDPADPRVAERFELFLCGIELANAFVELTDAAEQRARFEADRARRRALGGQDWPMDEDLLAALAHGMPQCAGIALGFDRLAMIASGADRIEQVLWL
jgi:lysyl-tRNA synthetase class 2